MYDLGRQAAQRLRMWREELPAHLSTPVATVDFSFCTTMDHPTPAEAERMAKRPCPVGTRWGDKWEYAWFSAEVTLPEACEGRRVVLFPGVDGEQLVYCNGRAIGAIDRKHAYVTLTRQGRAGERFRLLIESYAGHGARLEALGPCPPERAAIPPVTDKQCTVRQSVIAVWNEDAYQLMIDTETLDQLQQCLPDNSLRALRVAEALREFTHTADFELPPAAREASFRAAREALAPALACRNGSTAPCMWILGQSHIDLAWLWPMEESYHKAVRTYANQLTLMEEYPEYRFLLCEPALLDMLRERGPEVWGRIRAAASRGQIDPEGAFYVECDTNMPGGESLIRQLRAGKQWFLDQFGVDSQVAWQPDTFGYSGALPQILRKLGIPYFATEKLLRADPETQRFPYQNFIWEGIDGSTVEALSFFKANAPVSPLLLHRRWEVERSQRTNIDTQLYTFGYGDGGGGADRDMLEALRRVGDLEGTPRTRWGTLRGFFEETARQAKGNRWIGELYLAWHRGTYSVQRRQKAAMRRAEGDLRIAEGLLARLPAAEREARRDLMDRLWKTMMLNQFHDVAGGVGIARVHQEATEALQAISDTLRPLCEAWARDVYGIQGEEGYTLVNPLPWERRASVTLPGGKEIVTLLPPCGAVSADEAALLAEDTLQIEETEAGWTLRNPRLEVRVDRRGRVTGLTDLENGLPLLSPGQVMNDWRLYRNIQNVYDAWELDRDWAEEYLPDAVRAEARLTRFDPGCAEITVEFAFGESRGHQVIRMRGHARQIDFETEIDWRERRKMLKAHFESNILCENAIHEIQFGCIQRPCHRSHPYAADRYEVSNQRYSALCEGRRGFALLNDGLYGLSSGRGELALTLLRSPLVPDDTCDRGLHRFTYALLPFAVPFADAGIQKAGYELNTPALCLPGRCGRQDGFACDSDTVVLETVKPADDGNGIILRLYESCGVSARATLRLPFPAQVRDCGMDETEEGPSLGAGASVPLRLKPFEIMTLRAVPEV